LSREAGVERSWAVQASVCVLLFTLLLTPPALASQSQVSNPAQQYSDQSSWALGLVVSDNSPTSGGGRVSWATTTNVTAIVKLPDIRSSDGTIYAILSVMTEDGSVLQIASGLMPNATAWGTYAMQIRNPGSYPQNYTTVIDTPSPAAEPGSLISLSIFFSGGAWNFRTGSARNESVQATLNSEEGISPSLKAGDQEVFALESYTSDSSVFSQMGNLSLVSLELNGVHIEAGSYYYNGGWDPYHSPLFIVGGGTPPGFVLVQPCSGSLGCWSFRQSWSGSVEPSPLPGGSLIILAAAILVPVVIASVAILARRWSTT